MRSLTAAVSLATLAKMISDQRRNLAAERHVVLPIAPIRCMQWRLHSMVGSFPAVVGFFFRIGALKLFGEVLPKQSAAILHLR
jgi:hypothetical protein